MVDLGISKIHTSGNVFHLNNLADFSGHDVAGAEGIAAGAGVNEVILRNDHGVVLRLHGKEKGVRLQVGAEGVSIELADEQGLQDCCACQNTVAQHQNVYPSQCGGIIFSCARNNSPPRAVVLASRGNHPRERITNT